MPLFAMVFAACGSQQTGPGGKPWEEPRAQKLQMLEMTTARADHAAVALGDGRVLIAGGTATAEVGGVQSSAELYDPRARAFARTGSMHARREGETATVLNDGRVLIVGGADNIGYRSELASAELYDPGAGTFTLTGSMSTEREGHAATRLKDGRVLVTGGSDNGAATLLTAEIFDPSTGHWSATGSLQVPREAHTSTLLGNGMVLVAGGGRGDMPGGYIAYDSAELYDPSTGKFSPVARRMTSDRVGAAAVALTDGRVLVVGGKSGRIIAGPRQGNLESFTPLNTADIFDPESGMFMATGNMRAAHYLPTATLLQDGTVLVVGGWRMQGPIILGMREADLFDPAQNGFRTIGPTHIARLNQTTTLLPDGSAIVAG
ncbi:MAG: Kelch repeat-containing protein, partial [Candidatus Binataceae bacterium]